MPTNASEAQAQLDEHALAAERLTKQPAAMPEPVSRAQAVQQAILQAAEPSTNTQPGVLTDAEQASEAGSESESEDDLLAQLSHSMFAALRPDATGTGASAVVATQSSKSEVAERDSLSAHQPQTLHPGNPTVGICLHAAAAAAATAAAADLASALLATRPCPDAS